MRPRPGEKKEQWLLIKAEDEFARPAGEPDITEEETTSAISGRTTEELAAQGELRKDHAGRGEGDRGAKDRRARPQGVRGARKGILPAFLEPSLPQVTDKPPSGPKWVHEIKYDGYRMQARIDGREVRLLTRKGLDWTSRFPNIAAALEEARAQLRADGRRDRGGGFRGHSELHPAAGGLELGPARSLPLFPVRPALLRRVRSDQSDAAGSQGAAATRSPADCPPARQFASASTWRRTGR